MISITLNFVLCSLQLYPAAFIVCLVAFFSVGLVMTSMLWHIGWRVRPSLLALLVVGCSSALGYGFFWLYLASPIVGKLATFALVAALPFYFLIHSSRMKIKELIRLPDLWIPFVLVFSAGLFLTAITYAVVEHGAVCHKNDTRFVERQFAAGGADYLIQDFWANSMTQGSPPWHAVLDPQNARTVVSDRPPLLAGIVLIFKSLVPEAYAFVYYMAMTSVASLAWIPAIWGLARTAGLTLARTSALIVTLTFVFYFWFSTIYSWPKALSGSLFVGAFLLLFLDRKNETESMSLKSIILGAGFAGLSFATHNSTALLLQVMALLMLMPNRWLGLKHTTIAACVFLAITMPYMVLKSVNEVSSSSLAKWTFSGPLVRSLPQAEYDAMSILDVMRRTYSTLSWREIIRVKAHSVASIASPPCLLGCDKMSFKLSRGHEFWSILGSLKLFNLGWLILVPLLLGGIRLGLPPPWVRVRVVARDCILVALPGLIGFALLTFDGVSNIVSSGFMLLLFAAMGLPLFSLPWKIIALFSLLVVANFLWFTVNVYNEEDFVILDFTLLALALLATGVLAAIIKASARVDHADSPLNMKN